MRQLNPQKRFALPALTALAVFGISITSLVRSATAEEESSIANDMGTLVVKVVDDDGEPIAGAAVTPWAIRSSAGHGLWRRSEKKGAPPAPKPASTGKDGLATIAYPKLRHGTYTTSAVSIFVDHPDFAYEGDAHINVPRKAPYVITLAQGGDLEIRPTLDGKPAELDGLHVLWSDGRSWKPGAKPEITDDQTLRINSMPAGANNVLLVTLDGALTTYFSPITDVNLPAGKLTKIDVPLVPARRIQGVLSPNVPRPIRNGRIKIQTIEPPNAVDTRPQWMTWVPIQANGSFTITGWPTGERIQLIALCDGYIAETGEPPEGLANPPRNPDPYGRPQVFDANSPSLEVAMTPMARCELTVTDRKNNLLPNIKIRSWPNVCWWNSGSQIYCHPLVRGEQVLINRNYMDCIDEAFPFPFQALTDDDGKATMELPVGTRSLAVDDDIFELPAIFGRDKRVKMVAGETTKVALRLKERKPATKDEEK